MSKGKDLDVMVSHGLITGDNHVYNFMGVDKVTHIHINNFKTNKNSVMVPLSELIKAVKEIAE